MYIYVGGAQILPIFRGGAQIFGQEADAQILPILGRGHPDFSGENQKPPPLSNGFWMLPNMHHH